MFSNASVYLKRLWVLFLCTVNISTVIGVENRHLLETSCGTRNFQCDSTRQCIKQVKVCDGKPDCTNYEDESLDLCSIFNCSQSAFRCRYGACVPITVKCNGIRDCYDGSDEDSCTTLQINDTSRLKREAGGCIMPENPTNGVYTIGDTPAGTYEPASHVPIVSALVIQCNARYKSSTPNLYPICFNGVWSPPPPSCARFCQSQNSTVTTKVTCSFNGIKLESCEDPVEGTLATISCKPLHEQPGISQYTLSVCRNGSWDRPFTQCLRVSSCTMPENPTNGVFKIGDTRAGTYKPRSHVPMASALIVQCNAEYKRSPPDNRYPICINGKWTLPPPSCARFCQSQNSTVTTKLTCSFNNMKLESCENPIEGTLATISCEPLHEEPGISGYPSRVCRDGSWDSPFTQCFPVCGRKRPEGTPNVIGGTVAKQGDYPWHVGLYTKEEIYICGGSLVSMRVVVTAAHCVTNSEDGSVYPKEDYKIAAGKYFRTYSNPNDQLAQNSDIDGIHVPLRYKGAISQYEADIAIIILTTQLTLSIAVQPVCIDWTSEFEFQQISGNTPGVVTGWGQTAEGRDPSEELKELSVPVIPYEQCYEQVPIPFRKFITHDKVCAGLLGINTAGCQGDSGGGLTFPNANNRYYIRGIVSTSPATINKTCDSNQYGTYTLVSKHIDFVKQYALLLS